MQLLILDDWGLAPLTGEQRRDLLEIIDDRYERGSTIVTSQVPVDHWHEVIGDSTLSRCLSFGSGGASDSCSEFESLLWR